MSADAVVDKEAGSAKAPHRKTWIYILVVALVIISFGYLQLIKSKDSFANHDFYRVLYEATNNFNENMTKLDRMHRSRQSASAISSVLPSYSRTGECGKDDVCSYSYEMKGNDLKINFIVDKKPKHLADLDIEDILPMPKHGFSRYLFADHEGEVLATNGGEKTISIVDLDSINRELHEKKRRFRFNLKEQKGTNDDAGRVPLPSYSSHADIKLSYGDFRVFIFPFLLDTEIKRWSEKDNKYIPANKLYLVGLLPKENIIAGDSGQWNVSLLFVTMVSLLFMWTLLRLYLLPKNQSITSAYRHLTIVSSYAFYVVIIALLLSFMQKLILQDNKDRAAFDYAIDLRETLREDLNNAFSQLSKYRPFYQTLLTFAEKNRKNYDYYTGALSAESSVFPETLAKAIGTLTKNYCEDEALRGLLPKYAWTSEKVYPIDIKCNDGDMHVNMTLDKKIESVFLNAYKSNASGVPLVSLVAGNLEVHLEPNVASYISVDKDSYLPSNILTVFALSPKGNTVLPSINYQETNYVPKSFSLSHRDYYKKVFDQQGWQLCLSKEESEGEICQFNNVYIQRLLNINDGTRGTTISMSLPSGDGTSQTKPTGYTLGADVILPSVSLAEPAPQDFTYMVVDRNNGDVLFHSDESRTLVENLFFSGNSNANLSQWIKAGLDSYPTLGKKVIRGHYHGQSGRFLLTPSPVDAWAIVIFYPNDSLDAFMTNQFLFISVGFALALLVLVGVLRLCEYFLFTDVAKKRLCIPAKINGRMIIMVGSVIISVIYSLYNIGLVVDLSVHKLSIDIFSLMLPSLGLFLLLYFLYQKCRTRFLITRFNQRAKTEGKGLNRLFIAAAVLSGLHLSYLYFASQGPLRGLEFHYQRHHCNWLNYERKEINKMGLSRFPNSITKQRIAPLDLLLTDDRSTNGGLSNETKEYTETLRARRTCDKHSSQIEPEDSPNLSTQVGATYLWHWVNTYLLPANRVDAMDAQPRLGLRFSLWSLFGCGILVFGAIFSWSQFNRRILWTRLYCPERFLQNIQRLAASEVSPPSDERNHKLSIECGATKLNGIGLSLLLRAASTDGDKLQQSNILLPGFAALFQLSPCLRKISSNNSFLPNLKLCITEDPENDKLNVQLWDIETCLEKSQFRQNLLDLIMEFKSLTLASQLNTFTIFTGFHSFQRVKMKDPLSIEEGSVLEHAEYLSWAECLMDFNVKVPEVFEQGLDITLLKQEIADLPELSFLNPQNHGLYKRERNNGDQTHDKLWNNHEDDSIGSKWATINYILLHAEALYRFKWESCSNAEKLALFNLAKRQRLNPTNTQMIAHLALNGLIKVKHGELEITNRSFAHFILNAETTETLNNLIRRGEAGVWRNYRVPLGLLVVLIIVGIALTSGESIYIIAASVAGVLGTIVSVTNSANFLRGQIKN